MERRKYSRRNLKTPIPCMCRVGDGAPLHGFIRNVSLMGVMVEVPDVEDDFTVECRVPVFLDDVGRDNGYLFSSNVGVMSWVYKEYMGIAFAKSICSSEQQLSEWLIKYGQLCD